MKLVLSKKLENLLNFDLNNALEKALIQSSLIVQNASKDNAPYLSWNLKRSISVDYWKLKDLYTIVWSRLPYAKVRHRVNKKNPHTLRYLFRWYEDNETKIQSIFDKVIKSTFT